MNEEVRADSYAPAWVQFTWTGSQSVAANSAVLLPIPAPTELTGNIFEHIPATQSLRIKQAGVFGFLVNVACNASGVGNLGVLMRRQTPLHEWGMVVQPYYLHAQFAFASGGFRFVAVPAPCDYQIYVTNSGGTGTFTLSLVSIRLAFIGRR